MWRVRDTSTGDLWDVHSTNGAEMIRNGAGRFVRETMPDRVGRGDILNLGERVKRASDGKTYRVDSGFSRTLDLTYP